MTLSAEQLESLYTTMVRIRRFDEKTAELFQAGLVKGTAHSYVAEKIRRTDHVRIAFFGDGGANQGVVHEAMNLAAVWALPIVFLCENNQYALSTASKRTTAGPSIAARAAGYDIPGARVDGNDVHAVFDAVDAA